MIKKVKSVQEKQTQSGKTFYQVTFDDDVVASGFDEQFKDSAGKELDVEIKPNGSYTNVSIIKQNKPGGGKSFVPKNPKLEVLSLAVEFAKLKEHILPDGTEKGLKSADVLAVAKSWHEWIVIP